MLLSRSLEIEGHIVTGTHNTLYDFIEGFDSKEVDSSATVIMEGRAGLSVPVQTSEIIKLMTHIRKQLKHTRLIIQLDTDLQNDVEFIRSLVNLGIHDLQFTMKFRSEDVMGWIREKKTTRDYYSLLGKQKKQSIFSRNRTNDESNPSESSEPISPPANPQQSLTRPEPGARTVPVIRNNHAAQTASPARNSNSTSLAVSERIRNNVSSERVLPPISEPAHSSSINTSRVVQSNGHMPLIIGMCGVGGEEDVGAAVFLIAAGLVSLGWKPIVCGDDRPEISSLEEVAFEGEKDAPTAKMFEYEGVTFYRRGYTWDISELMTSQYTHIIIWLDIHRERKGINGLELWWNSQVPIIVGNGAMWKYELLKEKLNTLNPFERKRCRLLLENGHQDVLRKLRNDFEEIQAALIPQTSDPLAPDKEAVEWVMQLLSANKKLFRKPVIIWTIIGTALFISLILIFIGISIVPESNK